MNKSCPFFTFASARLQQSTKEQVQAYYTRLLRRGKRGECFVVNYSLVRVLKGPASC